MSRQFQRLLSLVLIATCAILSSGCNYIVYRALLGAMPPPDPIVPGVRTDDLSSDSDNPLAFRRKDYRDLGPVMAIAGTECAQVQPNQLLIAAMGRAIVVEDGREVSRIEFEEWLGDISIVDVDGDGICEFVDHGGGWQDTHLLSADGTMRWSFGGFDTRGPAANIMRPAQLDATTTELEFLVGMNGRGGLFALDVHGQELWRQEAGNVFSVDTVDLNRDGQPEVIHSSVRAGIVARNTHGEFLGTLRNFNDGPFSVLRRRGEDPLIVQYRDEPEGLGFFELRDLKGVLQTDLPVSEVGHGDGTVLMVHVTGHQPMYALSRTLQAVGARSSLSLYTMDGRTVYDEILESSYTSAQVVEWETGQPTLVVGGFNHVLILGPAEN